jgi:hypothetical protein
VEIGDLVRVMYNSDPIDAYSPWWTRTTPLYGLVLKIDTYAIAMELEPSVLLYLTTGEVQPWMGNKLILVNKV